MRRLAVLSLHTSPLAQPGTGDGGGMNVYVRELSSALARAGVELRRLHPGRGPPTSRPPWPWSRGSGCTTSPPGRSTLVAKEDLPGTGRRVRGQRVVLMSRGQASARRRHRGGPAFDAVHANYWLSGLAGTSDQARDRSCRSSRPSTPSPGSRPRRAPRRSRPTSRTGGPRPRRRSCAVRRWSWPRARWRPPSSPSSTTPTPAAIRIVAPGVDHAFFGPGHRPQARRALGLPRRGAAAAVRRSDPAAQGCRTSPCGRWRPSTAGHPDAHLVVVGGPERPAGRGASGRGGEARRRSRPRPSGSDFVEPRPHELLSTYYRAADVCLVPSRSESFGLVALESAACGTPVVASAVGGLHTLVDDGHTGFLVEDPDTRRLRRLGAPVLDDPCSPSGWARGGRAGPALHVGTGRRPAPRAIYEELDRRADSSSARDGPRGQRCSSRRARRALPAIDDWASARLAEPTPSSPSIVSREGTR